MMIPKMKRMQLSPYGSTRARWHRNAARLCSARSLGTPAASRWCAGLVPQYLGGLGFRPPRKHAGHDSGKTANEFNRIFLHKLLIILSFIFRPGPDPPPCEKRIF